MSIEHELAEELKDALRAGDARRKNVIRAVQKKMLSKYDGGSGLKSVALVGLFYKENLIPPKAKLDGASNSSRSPDRSSTRLTNAAGSSRAAPIPKGLPPIIMSLREACRRWITSSSSKAKGKPFQKAEGPSG